ncbi:MAG: GNAT family N-acetyltransferase [Anaerolineae bacterium]|nr:GNAT family N-acetyltransferase [Anaerolineae bacterium]
MSVTIERYTDAHRLAWDAFVQGSRNGVFLFLRDYMEYHRDRFTDHSLIAFAGGRLVALLPANQRGESLISHGGLTFGGWITDGRMKQALMIEVFDALRTYAGDHGLRRLIYKPAPTIYHRQPAQEDLYALFQQGARLEDRRAATALQGAPTLQDAPPFPKDRRYEVRKAQNAGVTAAETRDLAAFWAILEDVLSQQHDAKPVHTLAEMALLAGRFPQHIRLFGAYLDGALVAGVLVYESGQVARAQYIASGEHGRATGALDLLMDHLLRRVFTDKLYFDLGTSTEPADGSLNRGLIAHKEDFGGRSVMCDTYRLEW